MIIDKNDDVRTALSSILQETLEHFAKIDMFYYIAPYLHDGDINKEHPYFKNQRITLADINYTSDELKTIAYLAPQYRSRIAYNPANINKYLHCIGHLPQIQRGMDILCYEAIQCNDSFVNYITFEEWLLLPNDYIIDYSTDMGTQTAMLTESIKYINEA